VLLILSYQIWFFFHFAALVPWFSFQVGFERAARSGFHYRWSWFLLSGVFLSASASPISHLVFTRVASDQASGATLVLVWDRFPARWIHVPTSRARRPHRFSWAFPALFRFLAQRFLCPSRPMRRISLEPRFSCRYWVSPHWTFVGSVSYFLQRLILSDWGFRRSLSRTGHRQDPSCHAAHCWESVLRGLAGLLPVFIFLQQLSVSLVQRRQKQWSELLLSIVRFPLQVFSWAPVSFLSRRICGSSFSSACCALVLIFQSFP
jgi:hypothetical protein